MKAKVAENVTCISLFINVTSTVYVNINYPLIVILSIVKFQRE